MRSARSYTVTAWPARVSCWAAASPAGPEPTMATRLPVGLEAMIGSTHPSAQARSMIVNSTFLIVTASVLMPATQAALARGWAQPPGELGEVVGGVEPIDGLSPFVAVDEVVPVGDQVAQRAPVVAERDAAVHAAGGLVAQVPLGERLVDLVPVLQADSHGPAGRKLAIVGEEAAGISHERPPSWRRPDRCPHRQPGAGPAGPAGSRSASPSRSGTSSYSNQPVGARPPPNRFRPGGARQGPAGGPRRRCRAPPVRPSRGLTR